jgi:hypothetical protein
MIDRSTIFADIDNLIDRVNGYKNEPLFSNEISRRQNKRISPFLKDHESLRTFAYLIAYSQNANSELVERLINSGKLDTAFENFELDKVVRMNPCDIADNHWKSISAIRQQAKLFHIVSLARKLKSIGSISATLNNTEIPRQISTAQDIENFWIGFDKLQATLKQKKIPFFQSTTSLLHFLLDTGYDCIKPDLVVMRVSQKLKIVDSEKGDKNFRTTVRTVQQYSLDRQIRPTIVDFYFLIDEGQRGAKKFVTNDFYK